MPEMIRKLIPEEVSPAFISTSYSHNKDKYNKALKLSEREQKIVSNLSSDGFLKCETNLLYKLCQYFDFVTAPLDGWGSFNNELQNIGDAVEAIVKLRNKIIHNSNHDHKKTLDRMVEIAKVVDKELSTDERFEDAVKSFCVHEFDENYVDEFKSAFLNMTEEATNGSQGSFEDDVLKEDEPMCFDEDYNPDVLQKPIVFSSDLFENTGECIRTEMKNINEFTDKLFKQSPLKDKLAGCKKSLRSRKRKSTSTKHDLQSLSSESEADVGYASSSPMKC